MPRTILFDVDGVLIHGYHTRPELQRRWDENLLEDLGIEPKAFKERFIFDVFVKKVLVGQMGLIEALDVVLPQLGYRGPTQRFVSYWLEHDSHINAELIEVAKRLKSAGAQLYIATNQEHVRAQWLWQTLKLGEVFDDMYYAARLGVVKPKPRFFSEVERRLGSRSEPPLFFDDAPEVVAAAREAGWEAVVYDGLEDCTRHPWIAARLQ
jgi:putative hydrolase of the HAD superfamily